MNKSTREAVKGSQALIVKKDMAAIERVLIHGDLSPMDEKQRIQYVKALCKAIGVSLLFRPFDYIKLQGKTVLYANRACAEQLRIIHKISIKITHRERVDGLYVVTAQAVNGKGKTDESIGAINIKGLGGEALANALMKAETKAKRRVTLSIAGLGMLDEVTAGELAEQENKATAEISAEEKEALLAETTERPEFEKTRDEGESLPPVPPPLQDQGYIMQSGKNKGKPLSKLTKAQSEKWLGWYEEARQKGPVHHEVQDDAFHITAHLAELSRE